MKITKYMLVITSILVIGLMMNAGCKKGAQGDVADLGDGDAPSAESPPGTSGDDITISEVKLILPNDEELELDSMRISRHSKIKVMYEGELSSDIGLKMGGDSVAYTVLSDADGEALLKPKMPMHNLKEYELGDASFTVKAPGDINGDGLSDFVVGAPHWVKGSAHIFLGNEDMDYLDYTSGKRIDGNVDNAQFGSALALGDINGDGLDDIAIGAPAESKGCVYIFHGSSPVPDSLIANGTENARICRDSGASNGEFGGSIALGDLNGDGFEDLIIGESLGDGAHNSLTSIADAGVVKVIFGSAAGIADKQVNATNRADNSYHSITKNQKAGYSVAAGDVTGDGLDDVIIGAIGSNAPPATNCVRGKVFIINGATDLMDTGKILVLESKAEETIEGEGCVNDYTDRFGLSLAAMTVAEKDAVLIGSKSVLYKYALGSTKEIIMGIPLVGQGVVAGWLGEDIGFGYPPTSKLLIFDPEGDMQNPTIFDGSSTSSALGCAITPAGDLNGDGDPDFIVGEKQYIKVGLNERGRVWINALQKEVGGFGDSHFGTAVAGGRIR